MRRNGPAVLALLFAGGWWSAFAWIVYIGHGDKTGENAGVVLVVGAVVALIVAAVALDD